jgi:hypothetical protein
MMDQRFILWCSLLSIEQDELPIEIDRHLSGTAHEDRGQGRSGDTPMNRRLVSPRIAPVCTQEKPQPENFVPIGSLCPGAASDREFFIDPVTLEYSCN